MAADESNKMSPKTSNKIKFFCSHGGMILPRPCDGTLKYVGGETRVISAPRSVSFFDLMRKINAMFEGEFVIKYQIGPEELDALVSVKSPEDLGYMLDEYDRLERGGGTRLRIFLFPLKPVMAECHSPTSGAGSLEQRYVDALNGIVRSTTVGHGGQFGSARRSLTSTSRLKSMCSSPSECSSPCSISPRSVAHSVCSTGDAATTAAAAAAASFVSTLNGKLGGISRVRSSPSLYGLDDTDKSQALYSGRGGGYQSGAHHQLQHQHQHHQQQSSSHYDAIPPWASPVRDEYTRVSVVSNHPPPTNMQTSTHYPHPFHKGGGGGGGGGHHRWAHYGQYPSGAYAGASSRPISNHSEPRGIIWE